MKKLNLLLLGVFISFSTVAQDTILNYYIKTGLENNLALKQKQANYDKSMLALKEAKGLFFPDISFQARYSVADGGRTIDFPVGDLMNPVYNSLNGITSMMFMNGLITDPSNVFPDISVENEEIAFMRPQEHETKLELVQPILNTQIYYNHQIKRQLTEVQSYNVDAYKRKLVAEIKSAYFNYLKTERLLDIFDETEELVKENIRLNKKMFENDKVTIDAVYKAQTDQSKLKQQIAQAKKKNKASRAYFNFLINRSLDKNIKKPDAFRINITPTNVENAKAGTEQREELYKLEKYQQVMENTIKMNKSNKLPTISAVVDYGFQGEEYNFGADDDFVIASVVLRWDLFKGFQNKHKIAQAKVDLASLNFKNEEVKNQLKLQAINAYYEVEASAEAISAAKDELKTARKAYQIIEKKYKQGQANQLEMMDARTSFTNAQQNLVITEYDYYIKLFELERIMAAFDFNTLENN